MDGCGFPDDDAIADDQAADFPVGMDVLRWKADESGGPDFAILADDGFSLDVRMFVNDCVGADSHGAFDDAVGPDTYILAQLGIAINNDRGVYPAHSQKQI